MTTFGDRIFQLGGQPVGSDLLGLMGVGNVRYIDPNGGSDGNTGKTPDRAWKTIQYAADQSGYSQANGDSTGKHDILLRMPGVEELSATIDFDGPDGSATKGASIEVVATTSGLNPYGDVLGAHTRAASGHTDNLVQILYRLISFYGLSFGGRGTGSADDGTGALLAYRVEGTDANIQTAGGGNFHTVMGCNFRDDGGNNVTGIYEYGAGAAQIIGNTFGYNSAARGPTGIVIRGSGTNNPFDVSIRNNYFKQCPLGIDFRSGTYQTTLVDGNLFQTCTLGMHFRSGMNSNGLISNNRFSTATGAATWTNSAGATGATAANTAADTGMEFAGNMYTDDDNN